MTEASESSPTLFKLLVALIVSMLTAGSVLWAYLDPSDDPFFLAGPVLIATLAFGLVAALLSLFPKARRRRDVLPGWFMIAVLLQVAGVTTLILLLIAALATSLFWPTTAPYLLKAAFILAMAGGQVAIWTYFALQLHRLLGPEPNLPALR